MDAYSKHCSELESAVANHSFDKVESIIQSFWSEASDRRGDVESDASLAKAAEVSNPSGRALLSREPGF